MSVEGSWQMSSHFAFSNHQQHQQFNNSKCNKMAEREVIFTGGEPPQTYIFCGRCNRHFMACGCSDVGHGVDYVFKNLPDPSPNLTQMELLRRFTSLVMVVPSMGAFSVMPWQQNEGPGIVAAIVERESQLRQMMDDYVATLPSSAVIASDPVESVRPRIRIAFAREMPSP